MAVGDKYVGKDVTIWALSGTTPTFVGGQSEATFERSKETIEVTTKKPNVGEVVHKEFLPGAHEWTAELEGFVVDSDEGAQLLEDSYENDTPLIIQWRMPSGQMREGTTHVTELSDEGPLDDGYAYSGTLQGTGSYTVGPIPAPI